MTPNIIANVKNRINYIIMKIFEKSTQSCITGSWIISVRIIYGQIQHDPMVTLIGIQHRIVCRVRTGFIPGMITAEILCNVYSAVQTSAGKTCCL